MSGTDLADRFALPARLLHWVIAAAVPFQIYLGWAAEWEESRTESFRLIRSHFQLGAAIFMLMILRITWRLGHRPPATPESEPRWRSAVAATVHWILYALMLTMPLSGYVIWVWMDVPMEVLRVVQIPTFFTPPVEDESGRAIAWYLHIYSSWILLALAALHIAAALWHHFVRRDDVIGRML